MKLKILQQQADTGGGSRHWQRQQTLAAAADSSAAAASVFDARVRVFVGALHEDMCISVACRQCNRDLDFGMATI